MPNLLTAMPTTGCCAFRHSDSVSSAISEDILTILPLCFWLCAIQWLYDLCSSRILCNLIRITKIGKWHILLK